MDIFFQPQRSVLSHPASRDNGLGGTSQSRKAGRKRQNGYGGFSVGLAEVDSVAAYIERQEEHHRVVSFQDEYRKFLQKYEVEYDERYVWD